MLGIVVIANDHTVTDSFSYGVDEKIRLVTILVGMPMCAKIGIYSPFAASAENGSLPSVLDNPNDVRRRD